MNKEAALSLGWENPIGKELKYGGNNGLPLHVIGVVENFHYVAKHELIKPMVIIPSFNRRMSENFLSIKLQDSNIRETVASIGDAWSKYAGDTPFEYYFFDEAYDQLYRNEQHTMSVFIVFSILTVFIAILGLVGLVIYSTEQRTKEIGIRKSLGASVNQVVLLLSKDYAKWIVIGFILSCPLAYLIINKWLENFAYKVSIQWWIYPVSGTLAIMIALFAISFQAYKAAFRNPVEALRDE
jgi:putative ABC transport system permease protein